jgi:hypothetical protein
MCDCACHDGNPIIQRIRAEREANQTKLEQERASELSEEMNASSDHIQLLGELHEWINSNLLWQRGVYNLQLRLPRIEYYNEEDNFWGTYELTIEQTGSCRLNVTVGSRASSGSRQYFSRSASFWQLIRSLPLEKILASAEEYAQKSRLPQPA